MSVCNDHPMFDSIRANKSLCAGVNTAQQLASQFAGRFKVLLIEKNSHFQHLFAYPRFAVAAGVDTHKAFIPYTPGTFANCPKESGSVIQARVLDLTRSKVLIDRKVSLDGQTTDAIPYSYLVCVSEARLLPFTDTCRSSPQAPNLHHRLHFQGLKS